MRVRVSASGLRLGEADKPRSGIRPHARSRRLLFNAVGRRRLLACCLAPVGRRALCDAPCPGHGGSLETPMLLDHDRERGNFRMGHPVARAGRGHHHGVRIFDVGRARIRELLSSPASEFRSWPDLPSICETSHLSPITPCKGSGNLARGQAPVIAEGPAIADKPGGLALPLDLSDRRATLSSPSLASGQERLPSQDRPPVAE